MAVSKSKMKTKSRIESILKTAVLDSTVTGIDTFDLSSLDLPTEIDFELPTNLRLGHLAEKVVAELLKLSSNYKVLFENKQIIKDKETIGELDFILEEIKTKQLIHMELAYKFYLFDPSISSNGIHHWIGPNRKDSLVEKLDKLKQKQFPLLNHPSTKSILHEINLDEIKQSLCLLASLFVPYNYNERFEESIQVGITGYYLNYEEFIRLNHEDVVYYIPSKTEWGIAPSDGDVWERFEDVIKIVEESIKQKQAPLCWKKSKNFYEAFFIVWW